MSPTQQPSLDPSGWHDLVIEGGKLLPANGFATELATKFAGIDMTSICKEIHNDAIQYGKLRTEEDLKRAIEVKAEKKHDRSGWNKGKEKPISIGAPQAGVTDDDWRYRITKWIEKEYWLTSWGPSPNQSGCYAPNHIRNEYPSLNQKENQ